MPGKTTVDGVEIEHIGNSAVRIDTDERRIYVDVFDDVLGGDEPDGDLFLSTHAHFDHYGPDVINDLARPDATVVAHETSDVDSLVSEVRKMAAGDALEVGDVAIEAVPAHNLARMRPSGGPFHPAGEGVGYVFDAGGVRFYHPGDTEPLDHMADIDADVMFVPIGGKAVMGLHDAYWALNLVRPDAAIPVHYGYVDGARPSPDGFEELLETLESEDGVAVEPHIA